MEKGLEVEGRAPWDVAGDGVVEGEVCRLLAVPVAVSLCVEPVLRAWCGVCGGRQAAVILAAKPTCAFRAPELSLASSDILISLGRRLLSGIAKITDYFAARQNDRRGFTRHTGQEPDMANELRDMW